MIRRSYLADTRRAQDRVSKVVTSTLKTDWGEVEYVDEGEGISVLLSHGIFGGHDNAVEIVETYVGPGFRTIGPSRFGYFGSTLPDGTAPAHQADAYLELLDRLELERVFVLGFSAGAPSAIQMALRHPHRLHGLILASAYLPGMARPLPSALRPLMSGALRWGFGWWLLKRWAPERLARIMGVPKGWPNTSDERLDSIRDSLFPTQPKRLGVVFDAIVSEPASNLFPLEEISVPTLLVHAADDRLAPYEHVPGTAARIPRAALVTVDTGGHLFLEHQAQVRELIASFIETTASQ
ncbi:MAG TPA: alpha/beta hydrolase [Acidimicrobiia bacterium]